MRRFFLLGVFCLCLPLTHALGVAQDYLENSTLYVMQGVSTNHRIIIQNAGSDPVSMRLRVSGDYTTIEGRNTLLLSVPAKTYDTEVFLNVTVPRDAPAGRRSTQQFTLEPANEDTGGMVPMSFRLSDEFIVEVVPAPIQKKSPWNLVLALTAAVLCLAVIAGLIARRTDRLSGKAPSGAHKVRTLHDLQLQLAELDDEEVVRRKTQIAERAYKITKDPERYHAIKTAQSRKEIVLAVRGK